MKAFMLFLAAVITAVLISFLFSWPVYWLWNHALVSAVDSVYEITWLQAWGIMILCHMLFKADYQVKHKD